MLAYVICVGQVKKHQHTYSMIVQHQKSSINWYNTNSHSDKSGYLISGQDNIAKLVDRRILREDRSLLLVAHFTIWREMCTRLFRDQQKSLQELVEEIRL